MSHLHFNRFKVWTLRLISGGAIFAGIGLIAAIISSSQPQYLPFWLFALFGHNRVLLHLGTTLSLLVSCRCIIALFFTEIEPSNKMSIIGLLLASLGAFFVIVKQAESLRVVPTQTITAEQNNSSKS